MKNEMKVELRMKWKGDASRSEGEVHHEVEGKCITKVEGEVCIKMERKVMDEMEGKIYHK